MDNLVLIDGEAVSRTFSPLTETGGTVAYVDRTTNATVAGQGEVVVQYSRATPSRPTTRINLRISDPKEELVDGVLKSVAIPRAIVDLIIPSEGIIKLDRTNLRTMLIAALSSTVMEKCIDDLLPPL